MDPCDKCKIIAKTYSVICCNLNFCLECLRKCSNKECKNKNDPYCPEHIPEYKYEYYLCPECLKK